MDISANSIPGSNYILFDAGNQILASVGERNFFSSSFGLSLRNKKYWEEKIVREFRWLAFYEIWIIKPDELNVDAR